MKADREAAKRAADRHENISLMEPLLIGEGARDQVELTISRSTSPRNPQASAEACPLPC